MVKSLCYGLDIFWKSEHWDSDIYRLKATVIEKKSVGDHQKNHRNGLLIYKRNFQGGGIYIYMVRTHTTPRIALAMFIMALCVDYGVRFSQTTSG